MTKSDMIRAVCKARNVSLAELSRRIGQRPQNLSHKLARNTVSFQEMEIIARALGVGYEQVFVFPNKEQIGIISDAVLTERDEFDFSREMIYNEKNIMTSSEMIRRACKKQKVWLYKLGEQIGETSSTLSEKLLRESISLEGMIAIAKALGIVYRQYYILPSGEKIGMTSEEH